MPGPLNDSDPAGCYTKDDLLAVNDVRTGPAAMGGGIALLNDAVPMIQASAASAIEELGKQPPEPYEDHRHEHLPLEERFPSGGEYCSME
ncbi:hypothetical protein LTR85_001158 [Meristemomyces frigidus]|nr:hypothetical protein LTR85_001158 [Meristemomyces frigidus]